MGAGKTTLAEEVARRLDREAIDLDSYIETYEGPIAEIFSQRGEAAFRELEALWLSSVRLREPVVRCLIQDRPRSDVAAELGIPEGTLASRLDAARKRLEAQCIAWRRQPRPLDEIEHDAIGSHG